MIIHVEQGPVAAFSMGRRVSRLVGLVFDYPLFAAIPPSLDNSMGDDMLGHLIRTEVLSPFALTIMGDYAVYDSQHFFEGFESAEGIPVGFRVTLTWGSSIRIVSVIHKGKDCTESMRPYVLDDYWWYYTIFYHLFLVHITLSAKVLEVVALPLTPLWLKDAVGFVAEGVEEILEGATRILKNAVSPWTNFSQETIRAMLKRGAQDPSAINRAITQMGQRPTDAAALHCNTLADAQHWYDDIQAFVADVVPDGNDRDVQTYLPWCETYKEAIFFTIYSMVLHETFSNELQSGAFAHMHFPTSINLKINYVSVKTAENSLCFSSLHARLGETGNIHLASFKKLNDRMVDKMERRAYKSKLLMPYQVETALRL